MLVDTVCGGALTSFQHSRWIVTYSNGIFVDTVTCMYLSLHLRPPPPQGMSGGTTVAGTMLCAHRAGIPIFVTGGIGGVHRGGEKSKAGRHTSVKALGETTEGCPVRFNGAPLIRSQSI